MNVKILTWVQNSYVFWFFIRFGGSFGGAGIYIYIYVYTDTYINKYYCNVAVKTLNILGTHAGRTPSHTPYRCPGSFVGELPGNCHNDSYKLPTDLYACGGAPESPLKTGKPETSPGSFRNHRKFHKGFEGRNLHLSACKNPITETVPWGLNTNKTKNRSMDFLVGGFQPIWQILVKLEIFPRYGGENKNIFETTT